MPGARCTRSLACDIKKHDELVTTGSDGSTDIPCAVVLTAYSALSPATNSSCHRHWRIKGCPSPVGPTRLRQLDTSNGCQDHTALPSVAIAVRPRVVDRSRKIALRSVHAHGAAASTASRAQRSRRSMRPSMSTERSNIATDREENGNELFLRAGLDDPNQIESIQEIFVWQKPASALAGGVRGAIA